MDQVFISYRRAGGDVTAKLICEALKNRGYTVFYDYDALKGGFFDTRLLNAIEGCSDFLLVLPQGGLERCENESDWVRQEIAHAIKCKKNIIPVMLPGFEFPEQLPEDIDQIRRYNGVRFMMDYFEAVIDKIAEKISTPPRGRSADSGSQGSCIAESMQGRLTVRRVSQYVGCVRNVKVVIDGREAGTVANGKEAFFPITEGEHQIRFSIDWLNESVPVTISPAHPESIVEVSFATGLIANKLQVKVLL